MLEAVVRAGVIVISHLLRQELEKKKYKKERLWIRSWISRREKYGASNTLLKELKHEDFAAYQNILRMNLIAQCNRTSRYMLTRARL
jgi:hypothetical protein